MNREAVEQALQLRVVSPGCPHCAGGEVVAWGRDRGQQRYRCKSCLRTFNVLTKTPLGRLRKKGQMLEQSSALIGGTTLMKAAQQCDVSYTTAFRWRHRLQDFVSQNQPEAVAGIVEKDDKRRKPRASRKRGLAAK